MAINIKFDLTNNPEPPTIVLARRNGDKLGQLKVNQDSIELNDKFNDASEISFTLNKYIDGKITNLWNDVVDFKLVHCKEWDMWFEITVELDEETETVKTVFCRQLGQAELSQIMIYNLTINQEGDSNWDVEKEEYKKTILYNPDDPSASLLHRILKDKAPHYSVIHVDDTIANIQRMFSWDGTSIYDIFMEIAEEIGCLFIFHSNSDENGKIQRAISVYDLQQNCLNPDCGYRGEFTDKCPKCNSEDIKYYGVDTNIFVTSDELATQGIQLTTDTDSVKNCFKLEAGDDLMTATIRNCNPNGTDYIWHFSEDMKSDMSKELSDKITAYDEIYENYYNDYESELDSNIISEYNALVEKYNSRYCSDCGYVGYFEGACPECDSVNIKLQSIPLSIKGYSTLMNAYYNTIDLALYLESGLMPTVDIPETNAEEQAALLTASVLSPVAVANVKSISETTAKNAVLAMAKIIVKSTFEVKIKESELSEDNKSWTGIFTVTNRSDEEDTADSQRVSIEINDDLETFMQQKIDKALKDEDMENVSVSGLFGIKQLDEFKAELKKYGLNPLTSFNDACNTCLTILQEQGVSNGDTWADTDEGSESNLYEKLYMPYYEKLAAIEEEILIRENELAIIEGVYTTDEEGVQHYVDGKEGIQYYLNECKNTIQDFLNFENYIGTDLWMEFCSYRREDKYSNDNYISDGLNNAELFSKAKEFVEVAENEIFKSAELQHSISTTLNNLLAIEKFESLVENFSVGNWMRVQINDKVYRLRLLEYNISYDSFENISVVFSDVTKVKTGITDMQSILSQASSMATSYSSIQRQASQGETSNTIINNWFTNGLDATNTKIVGNAENQNQVLDKNGFLCREYDPITGSYANEQLKIINSTIAITDDNWNTTKTAIGKYYYTDPKTNELKMAYGVNGETIIGRFILGENMTIQNESGSMKLDGDGFTVTSGTGDNIGTMTFGEEGLVVSHGNNTVTISPESEEVINITNGEDDVFEINENGELTINGNIIARSLKLENGVKIDSGVITNLANIAVSGSYDDLVDVPTKLSDFENDGVFITKDVNSLTNYYKKTEVDNKLNLKVDSDDLATVATTGSYTNLSNRPNLAAIATSGSYTDLIDLDDLKSWINTQIQNAISSYLG